MSPDFVDTGDSQMHLRRHDPGAARLRGSLNSEQVDRIRIQIPEKSDSTEGF